MTPRACNFDHNEAHLLEHKGSLFTLLDASARRICAASAVQLESSHNWLVSLTDRACSGRVAAGICCLGLCVLTA